MKEEEILSGLENLLASLNIELRYEKGDFTGGYCIVQDKPMMIVQSGLNTAQKIKLVARELARMNLENVYLLPALREVIDEAASLERAGVPMEQTEGTLTEGA